MTPFTPCSAIRRAMRPEALASSTKAARKSATSRSAVRALSADRLTLHWAVWVNLGDAQKQLNQNRRPSCSLRSSPRTRMAVASMMRVFRACPFPTVGSWATSPRGLIHGLMTARIPWSQGKMQGISRNQPSFANIRLENISEFRCLRMNSLRRQSREFFCQRREFFCRAGNEQGIRRKTDPRAPTHPMASEYFSVLDTKIINNMVACADEHAWLLRTGRASDARVEPRIKSGRRA